jgi:plasmid stability protein
MATILIPNLDETVLRRLRERANLHGRTLESEAQAILQEALRSSPVDVWAEVNAIRERLAASGRSFSDSAELLREDRDR